MLFVGFLLYCSFVWYSGLCVVMLLCCVVVLIGVLCCIRRFGVIWLCLFVSVFVVVWCCWYCWLIFLVLWVVICVCCCSWFRV